MLIHGGNSQPIFGANRKRFRDSTWNIQNMLLYVGMSNINPYWITGFVDGEGTFYVGINKNKTMKTGYQVLPEFRIVQHKKDIQLLHKIKKFFSCGVVRVNHDDRYEVRIRDLKCLKTIVIPFFEKHKLQTQKKFDFMKFRKIVMLMDKGEHLNKEGIQKIYTLAEKMNTKSKIITRKHLDKD